MIENAFVGRKTPPAEEELSAALGPVRAVWDHLIQRLADDCGVVDREWYSYSPKAGSALRLKRAKRNIVYLSPGEGCFGVSFALGEKAVRAALEAGLPKAVVRTLKEFKRYAEGTMVRLEIASAKDIPAVIKLAAIKLAN
jgi:hypothetical protein